MRTLFRGSPRLLIHAAPWVMVILVAKAILLANDVHPLELSPLLGAAIAAEVFIVGFLLSGTAGVPRTSPR